jgi:hypothetical protein
MGDTRHESLGCCCIQGELSKIIMRLYQKINEIESGAVEKYGESSDEYKAICEALLKTLDEEKLALDNGTSEVAVSVGDFEIAVDNLASKLSQTVIDAESLFKMTADPMDL